MDKEYPREAWRRLGKDCEARRGQLGYGFRQRDKFLADRGGPPPSLKMVARLERGERTSYPPATIASLEALYELAPGSFEAILGGGEGTPLPGTPGSAAPSLRPVPSLPPDDPGEMTDAEAEAWLRGLMAAAPPEDRNLHNLAGDTRLPVRDRVAGVAELLAFRRWVRDRKPGSDPAGDARLRSSLRIPEGFRNESADLCPCVPFRLPGAAPPGVGIDT
jgi:hypothetical protein